MKNIVNKIFTWGSLIKRITIMKITFILTGIASIIWFLVRVIPKPSRATYPCMRVAAPVMSGFIIYLLSLVGSAAAFKKAKLNFYRSNYITGVFFILVALAGSLFVLSRDTGYASAKSSAEWIIVPNQPVGVAKGIFPGRV